MRDWHCLVSVCLYAHVCTQTEVESGRLAQPGTRLLNPIFVCVSVCEREREREWQRMRVQQRDRMTKTDRGLYLSQYQYLYTKCHMSPQLILNPLEKVQVKSRVIHNMSGASFKPGRASLNWGSRSPAPPSLLLLCLSCKILFFKQWVLVSDRSRQKHTSNFYLGISDFVFDTRLADFITTKWC